MCRHALQTAGQKCCTGTHCNTISWMPTGMCLQLLHSKEKGRHICWAVIKTKVAYHSCLGTRYGGLHGNGIGAAFGPLFVKDGQGAVICLIYNTSVQKAEIRTKIPTVTHKPPSHINRPRYMRNKHGTRNTFGLCCKFYFSCKLMYFNNLRLYVISYFYSMLLPLEVIGSK